MKSTRETGKIGEGIACKWLENHGFSIVTRNYLKKWGEIDIVAEKKGQILNKKDKHAKNPHSADKIFHFIEVKSQISTTKSSNSYRLEENVHNLKLQRLRRVIQSYLAENHQTRDPIFFFHVLTVIMNPETRRARVNMLENIVL
jgi:putative endonuclease